MMAVVLVQQPNTAPLISSPVGINKIKPEYILVLKMSPKDNLRMRLPPVGSFLDKAVAFSSPKDQ